MQIDQLTIVGVGLIGGSIGLAAKARGIAKRVVGVGRDERTLSRAVAGGVIDNFTTSIAEGVATADFVVVCTPVDRVAADVLTAARAAKPGTIITDVGSTKARIVREVNRQIPVGVHFIGSHPLAGSEKSGADFARADLFKNRITIVTESPSDNETAWFTVSHFWSDLGSEVIQLTPEDHDDCVAHTSHMPHAVASALAGVLPEDLTAFAASGFRDTTRIAAGDPELWAAIFEANRDAVLAAMDAFTARMAEFREALTTGDREKLVKWLADGKRVRDTLG